MVFLLWLGLGRYAERSINRTYERSMMDYSGIDSKNISPSHSFTQNFLLRCQRIWDYTCPLFLQRMIYIPPWNKRSHIEIVNQIKATRSNDGREHRSLFYANNGRKKGDRVLPFSKPPSFTMKVIICGLVGIGSFISVSPHYILNLCTVFFGSMGMVRLEPFFSFSLRIYVCQSNAISHL